MYVGTYLQSIRSLMDLKRYQNLFVFKQRSVAEHSWSVAKIAQTLAYIEQDKFGNQIDFGVLLQKCISHDELEIITGDILSNTKRRTKAMRRAVESLEKLVYKEDYVENLLPQGWEERFKPFTLDAKDGTIEGDILAAADVIDTLFESVDEIKLGNKAYFEDVYISSVRKLQCMELESVHHFLEHSLGDVIIGTELEQVQIALEEERLMPV